MSKRHDIHMAFHDVMLGVIPQPDGKWRKTAKGPFLQPTPQECPAFYTFDFQEQVIEEGKQTNDIVRAKLIFIVEVFALFTMSDDPSKVLNDIVQPVQAAFLGNRLGGLVQGVHEVGSKFKVESMAQRMVSAEIAYYATYFRKATE